MFFWVVLTNFGYFSTTTTNGRWSIAFEVILGGRRRLCNRKPEDWGRFHISKKLSSCSTLLCLGIWHDSIIFTPDSGNHWLSSLHTETQVKINSKTDSGVETLLSDTRRLSGFLGGHHLHMWLCVFVCLCVCHRKNLGSRLF